MYIAHVGVLTNKQCFPPAPVQLYDSNFNLLDTAKIDIKVGAACMCFGICGCVVCMQHYT